MFSLLLLLIKPKLVVLEKVLAYQHDKYIRWERVPGVFDHQISSQSSHVPNTSVGNLGKVMLNVKILASTTIGFESLMIVIYFAKYLKVLKP